MWRSGALLAMLVGCRFEPGALRDDAARDDSRLDTALTDGPMSDGPGQADAMIDGSVAKPCPATYTLMDNRWPASRYRSVTESTDWADAEAICEADGGGAFLPAHLIVLDDADERTWAYEQGTTDKWVGATDTQMDNTLRAVTDQADPHFGNAQSNEQSKDCMFINQNETVMESCNGGFQYLCECDGLAADPTNF